MKKLILTLFLGVVIGVSTHAQDKLKGYWLLSVGPAIPSGDFADDNTDNEKAGLAKVGYSASITYARKLGEKWGIAFSADLNSFGFDTKAFKEQLGGSWTSEPWTIVGVYAGGFYTKSFNDKISFDSRIMVGLGAAFSPTIKGTVTDDGMTAHVETESANANALAFTLNAGLRYNLSSNIGLRFGLGYFSTNQEFEVKQKVRIGSFSETDEYTLKQPIDAITIGLGVAFNMY